MDWVDTLPSQAVESFAGMGNPIGLGPVHSGETLLDVGSGGGFDCFIAAEAVGPTGQVIGVDYDRGHAGKVPGHRPGNEIVLGGVPAGIGRGVAGARRVRGPRHIQWGHKSVYRQISGLSGNVLGY